MKEEILLNKKICDEIIKNEIQKENFYYRYGKYFKYRSLKLSFDEWKALGGSVRLIMFAERNKVIESKRKKLYEKGGYVPLNTLSRKKKVRQIKCDKAKEKMNVIQAKYNKKLGLENYKYVDPWRKK